MIEQANLIREIIGYRSQVAPNKARLEHYGFKVFSQSDEDGIIEEIFKRVETTSKTFIEFGAETGQENNTRYLLLKGWTGLWIEGNPDYVPATTYYYENDISNNNLKFISSFVDAENINDLISSAGFKGEIDFLSIDIDGNDYHVFQSISIINPRVVIWSTIPPISLTKEISRERNVASKQTGSSTLG